MRTQYAKGLMTLTMTALTVTACVSWDDPQASEGVDDASAETDASDTSTDNDDDDAADFEDDDEGSGDSDTDAAPEEEDDDASDAEPSDSEDEGGSDLDEQDGVRTNSFGAIPDELADMRQVSLETNPAEHMVQLDYMATDEQSRMLFMAYIPGSGGGEYEPVFSHSDPGFRNAVDSGVQHFDEEGFDVITRSVDADGYEWECFEALETQSGGIDHSFCLTTEYGRVIEIQRLAMHGPDEQARNSHMDELLEEVSSALAEIG